MAAEKREQSSHLEQKHKTKKKKGKFCRVCLSLYLLSELSWLTEGRSCVRLESVLEL